MAYEQVSNQQSEADKGLYQEKISNTESSRELMTMSDFYRCFKTIDNNANGNCLFESMAYLLEGSLYELEHGVTSSDEIRYMVGEFYRKFDKDIYYPENTIEYRIKLGNMFDNIDDEMPHDYNIYNDKVWASMTDVLICSLIFEININLYKYSSELNMYLLEKINSQYNFPETVNLLYNGVNHFEALEYN